MKRTRLAARRKTVGLSQEKLAESLGVDRSTVLRWERGTTGPQPWHRPKLAELLKVSLDELAELLADRPAPPLHDRSSPVAVSIGRVDLMVVARIRQRIQDLDGLYDLRPSSELLAETAQLHGHIRLMNVHAVNGRGRWELRAAQAESALLLGQLVWDASHRRSHAEADQLFDVAIAAARDVGDATTEAHAELRKCYVALYGRKDPRSGLRQAEQASEASARISKVLHGLALLHAGEAHAILGNPGECLTALDQAAEAFADRHTDDPASVLYSDTVHGRLAGSCHLFLNEPAAAEQILTDTYQLFSRPKKSAAIVLSNLSLAHIRQGKLDEAVHWLHLAIDLLEQTRGAGGLNVAFTAGRELRPWRSEGFVADVKDRLLMLMSAA